MKNKGFSLVEMIVVIAIFIVITMVVIYNQNKFSSDISISNISHQVALKIREAQVYGTLVRQNEEAGLVGEDFNLAYGITFSPNPTLGGDPSFKLFADSYPANEEEGVYGNNRYDEVDGGDILINTFTLTEGNVISDICWFSSSDVLEGCFSDDDSEQLDIVFRRPDPDAIITIPDRGPYQHVEITITSALGDKHKIVTVMNTGQISITDKTNEE